jgi:hypothetical protein
MRMSRGTNDRSKAYSSDRYRLSLKKGLIGMDPVTAGALAIKAIAEMITEIVRGQPTDVREKAWAWWVTDMERFRKFWKID